MTSIRGLERRLEALDSGRDESFAQVIARRGREERGEEVDE